MHMNMAENDYLLAVSCPDCANYKEIKKYFLMEPIVNSISHNKDSFSKERREGVESKSLPYRRWSDNSSHDNCPEVCALL